MGKFSRDLDPELVTKVKNLADKIGLKSSGINIEPLCLKKSKRDYGLVMKSSDIVQLYTGDDSLVNIAINENVFNRLDSKTQEILIYSLLDQVYYDLEKDKIIVNKPELNIPLATYKRFGVDAVNAAEVSLHALAEIAEEEKMEKEAKKRK